MEISLTPEILTRIGSFPITNTLVVTGAVTAALGLTSYSVGKNLQPVPGKMQNIFEVVVEFLFDMIDGVMRDRHLTEKAFPLIATIFLFVLLSNWVEIIPGLGTVGIYAEHHGEEILVPFLRSASADLNMTLALAVISVVSVQVFGVTALGFAKYAKKFFVSPFHKPYGVGTFVGLLELVGEVSKMISFSFRLFGNIFAGEVLLMVILVLTKYFVPVPFLVMEIFVGVIQALVFAMLTAVFIKMATLEAH